MAENEIRKGTQDLELLDDFVEFDKSLLIKIINKGEEQAIERIRSGNISLTEKDVKTAARKLRRGIQLMDTKTLWAIVFQMKIELDSLIFMQKMKKEIAKPTVISRSGAEMFYGLQMQRLMK